MTAKFLVVEIDDNTAAVELVKIMLERGFARLMLLDDLSCHPALGPRRSEPPTEPQTTSQAETTDNTSTILRDILSLKRAADAKSAERTESEIKDGSELLELLQYGGQEIINVGIKEDNETSGENFTENEDMSFNFNFSTANQTHLDLLAQAHCLVSGPSSATPPPTKKSKSEGSETVDPDKDYHQCQMCGVRVKAPRGGRWNLQMHVMAIHSTHRPYKCQQCDFQDYRKPGMRKHCVLMHGRDMEPVDISTPEKRSEWDSVMSDCFPEFAYRTGFLLENKTIDPDSRMMLTEELQRILMPAVLNQVTAENNINRVKNELAV